MFLKFLHWLGITACFALIISCFLPWGYYADINQTFTGFYSYQNQYGKPGRFLLPLASLTLLFMLLPKVWAKRSNLFIAALTLAYVVKVISSLGHVITIIARKDCTVYISPWPLR
ncbi:MAG: hypothetical protein IPJ02_00090 [Chitinophagaceae bacterium]|nr:hypothetical protein [Chitinophagaceae bacterium]